MAEDGDDTGNETITLRVKDQTGDEMFFKVKKNTKMQKIFEAFASRKGIAVASLNFRLDGDRVSGEQTPKMLELEENDQIDVNLQMTGGAELSCCSC